MALLVALPLVASAVALPVVALAVALPGVSLCRLLGGCRSHAWLKVLYHDAGP